jgi:hypothetical protein
MTDNEIIRMTREYFEGLFPKVCPKCGRHYETLREYILNTKPTGATMAYDAESGDWETTQPIGAMALANCSCGTTLSLTTEAMPLWQIHLVLKWIRAETERRGLSVADLMGYVRDEVRKQVLTDSFNDLYKE